MKTLTALILTALLAACGGGEDLPGARVAAVTCDQAVAAGFKGDCK